MSEPMQAELRGGVTGSEVSIPTSVVVTNAPMCRICHMTADKDELLMSPCRCDGTLRHVHMSCLVHWLDICCKRLKKPAICELCAYRYRRRRVFKLKEFVWPRCRPMDKWLHIVFVFSLMTMLVSALATVVCFQLEKALGVGLHASSPLRKATNAPAAASNGSSSANGEEEVERDERSLAAIQLVTLVAGVSFLLCFFVALYSQVKAKHSLYKYAKRAWETNHEWVIADYCAERDYQYVRRLTNERAERRRQAFVASLTANAGPNTTADQQDENVCQPNVADFSSPAQQTVAPP